MSATFTADYPADGAADKDASSRFGYDGGGAVAGYTANAVNFDGTNDYLSKASAFTGAADSKLGTVSFWFKTTSVDVNRRIYIEDPSGFRVTLNNGQIVIQGFNSAASNILILSTLSGTGTYNDGVWHHCAASWDMANASNRHLIMDGSSDISVGAFTNDTIDYTGTSLGFGAQHLGGEKITADIADFQFIQGTYIDLSVAANLQKFRTAAGKPADPALSGYSPILLLDGDTATWHTNDGSGGGMTENGALTTASTSPSD